jgi:ubiquinone/menaquinone biosynthesis C-methylase UbiE
MMVKEIIEHYNNTADTYDIQFKGARWELISKLDIEYLEQYMPSIGMILNVGAGTGREINVLKSKKNQGIIVCLDASEKMLNKLCEKHSDSVQKGQILVVLGNSLNLPFKSEAFDFIYIQGLPLIVPRYGDLPARELVRVLRTNHCMAATVGNIGNSTIAKIVEETINAIRRGGVSKVRISDLLTYLSENRVCWEKEFYQYYCLEIGELEQLCKGVGLDIIEILGKPILLHLLSEQTLQFIYENPKIRRQMFDLEKKLSRDKSAIGNADNKQIITKKKPLPGAPKENGYIPSDS